MADKINKGEFIELDYTGKIKDDDLIFDTTVKQVADEQGLQSQKAFEPIIICAGEGHLLPGLDRQIIGAEFGKHEYTVVAEEAFGKKSAKLLQLVPRKVFKEQNVQPMPGLEIDVDGQTGTIRSASGGRVIVDFNHPLASKDLIYEVDLKRKVTDQAEKVKAILRMSGIPFKDVEVSEGKAVVTSDQAMPDQFVDLFAKDVVRLSGVTDLTFKKSSAQEKKPASPQEKKQQTLNTANPQ